MDPKDKRLYIELERIAGQARVKLDGYVSDSEKPEPELMLFIDHTSNPLKAPTSTEIKERSEKLANFRKQVTKDITGLIEKTSAPNYIIYTRQRKKDGVLPRDASSRDLTELLKEGRSPGFSEAEEQAYELGMVTEQSLQAIRNQRGLLLDKAESALDSRYSYTIEELSNYLREVEGYVREDTDKITNAEKLRGSPEPLLDNALLNFFACHSLAVSAILTDRYNNLTRNLAPNAKPKDLTHDQIVEMFK